MSKQKKLPKLFTPGPWKAVYRAPVQEWWIGMSPKEGSTVCGVKVSPYGPDEAEANARLIAAAPDLLISCKALLREIYEIGMGDAESGIEADARAAIAKAEGK